MNWILDKLFNKREIVNCDRDIYLHRWYVIRTKAFGLFIHKFVRSDEDRALHDHPWNFIVIPIWRGYIEHSSRKIQCPSCFGMGDGRICWCENCNNIGSFDVFGKKRVLPILGTRYRPAIYRHRVELLKAHWAEQPMMGLRCTKELPAWSIFIRFRSVREWGFWPAEGFIQWNKWWQEKCE